MAEKIVLSWSGGKDSALALERLLYHGGYIVAGLFVAYNKDNQNVKLHNVPVSLIRKQAESLNLPLFEVPLSEAANNIEYETAHLNLFKTLKEQGIHHIAYGDIFLEVIRNYRDELAKKAGMEFHYPLWNDDTDKISQEFIDRGFKAVVTAINADVLPETFIGRQYDEDFTSQLPEEADICGENGEFHTFVWDGPIFSQPVKYTLGKITTIDYRPEINMAMKFCDIEENREE